jgi:uncharacterized protein (TIGR03435 family)
MVILLLLQTPLVAQNSSPAFEVASIKPALTNQYIPARIDPQRFHIVTTLADAILWANDILDQNYRVSGGPLWAHRDYYQIEGKAHAPATTKELRAMLQTLLANRFKLRLHREAKEMSVYALVVGNSGPKLQSSIETCGVTNGSELEQDGCIGVAPGEFFAKYAKMDSIAATLSNMVDRPVLDQTGLAGHYDFRMKFDPSSVKGYAGQERLSIDAPSIFVAIQDLGLRLEPRRAAVEILVIDDAERPEPN